MIAGYLRWADVDPRQRPALDVARVTAVVRPHVEAARTARGPRYREALVETIERELLIEFGSWIGGWTWAANESGGGGPVHGWCCAEHSVFPVARDDAGGSRTDLADADGDPVTATTSRVVGAVQDWSRCLDEIAALFAELRREAPLPGPGEDAPAIELAIERAASRILPYVVDRTRAEDAWYGTFAKLLAWYAEPAGHDRELVLDAIEKTTSGKFESWMEPTEEVARDTCVELGRAIARADRDGSTRDATAEWIAARPGAFAHVHQFVPAPVRADGHQLYIDHIDHARDPERAERMSAALVLCRDSAKRGMRLTFDQMCEWQAAVLGVSRVEFRTATAYAKGGREVYPWVPTSQQRFENAIGESTVGRVSLDAARVYLDVCFHHPFADGNARAARLALDHVLTSAGYALHAADPVFVVSRTVKDRLVGWGLARVLERLIGPIAF